MLAAADPAQPYGGVLPWPKRAAARAARVAGAHVVLLGGEAALYVERGGRSLLPLREPDEEWLRPALAALVAWVRARPWPAPLGGALRRPTGRRERGDGAARRGRLPRRPAARRVAALSERRRPRARLEADRQRVRHCRRNRDAGPTKRGGPPTAPARPPGRSVCYGRATRPRWRVVIRTPARPAATRAAIPAPTPNHVQSVSSPDELT